MITGTTDAKQPWHADSVSSSPAIDTLSEFLNYAHNLMSRNDWVLRRDDISLDRMQVCVADSTGSYPE
jgi:hypothetical protein